MLTLQRALWVRSQFTSQAKSLKGATMSGRIEGKIALVVGAAQGIGEAIAKRFVEEGARVVIADVLDEVGQVTAKRLGGTYVHTDISDFEAAKQAVEVAVQNYGSLDIIVQNAGSCSKLWVSRYYCTKRGNLPLDVG